MEQVLIIVSALLGFLSSGALEKAALAADMLSKALRGKEFTPEELLALRETSHQSTLDLVDRLKKFTE